MQTGLGYEIGRPVNKLGRFWHGVENNIKVSY